MFEILKHLIDLSLLSTYQFIKHQTYDSWSLIHIYYDNMDIYIYITWFIGDCELTHGIPINQPVLSSVWETLNPLAKSLILPTHFFPYIQVYDMFRQTKNNP
jgi:hypothetical protein